jgi:hypothetical protein
MTSTAAIIAAVDHSTCAAPIDNTYSRIRLQDDHAPR